MLQVNEEVRELQKKLAQVEGDLISNKNNLEQANKDLEEKEKALTNVCILYINQPYIEVKSKHFKRSKHRSLILEYLIILFKIKCSK